MFQILKLNTSLLLQVMFAIQSSTFKYSKGHWEMSGFFTCLSERLQHPPVLVSEQCRQPHGTHKYTFLCGAKLKNALLFSAIIITAAVLVVTHIGVLSSNMKLKEPY